ncbi:MAG: pyruvate kinase [Thiobacillaceae bacterium]
MKAEHAHIAERLIPALTSLRESALALEATYQDQIDQAHPDYRDSARNLLHYVSLRQCDIRSLQDDLAQLGLSRLGQAEAHVMDSLNAILVALHALAGHALPEIKPCAGDMTAGSTLLNAHSRALLGVPTGKRATRIMVTLPSEAAADSAMLERLLRAGMDVVRINCAHDAPATWLAMIRNLRAAERTTGRSCHIHVDLAGPKLRTGPLKPIARLIEFKPQRDAFGRVMQPARVWLTASEEPEPPINAGDPVLPLERNFIQLIEPGDMIVLEDTRGSRRYLKVAEQIGQSWLALCDQHVHLEEGAACTLLRDDSPVVHSAAGPLPEVILPLLLKVGDHLMLTPGDRPGHAAEYDAGGRLVKLPSIPCTLAAVFRAAQPGQPIWFDDGRIGGRIVSNTGDAVEIEITHAAPKGSRLRPEKGINLPDTDLDIPALTEKDLADLRVLAPHIDMVGLSFLRSEQDVIDLHAQLAQVNARHLGTVLKIETRQAFEHLPLILLTALRQPPVGLMVARGDLAVEIGFERLAEVQEEILWLGEAAHAPVIWATQVLESMAKRGLPTRAEVSDAAKGIRAECVMLNKGPYLVETLAFLNGVLERMSGLQSKHRPMLRRLAVCTLPASEPKAQEMQAEPAA